MSDDSSSSAGRHMLYILGVIALVVVASMAIFPSYTAGTQDQDTNRTADLQHVESVDVDTFFPLGSAASIELDDDVRQYVRLEINASGGNATYYPKAEKFDDPVVNIGGAGTIMVHYYNTSGVVETDEIRINETRVL